MIKKLYYIPKNGGSLKVMDGNNKLSIYVNNNNKTTQMAINGSLNQSLIYKMNCVELFDYILQKTDIPKSSVQLLINHGIDGLTIKKSQYNNN